MDQTDDKNTPQPVSSNNIGENLSKNQQKKLKRRLQWEENKAERRKADKLKKKNKLKAKLERGEEVGPSRKNLKYNTMESSSCKIRVVLDLSLEEHMADKDITSLTSQIQHSYSANRRAENPMQLYCCGMGSEGRTRKRLDTIGDYKGWDVNFKDESYLDVFPKESIVYLSSDSPNVLTTLSEDQVYVIGGLVDHNSRKGLCHRLAEEKGVAHAQLPISDYFKLKGRKVLAVNHVFSILLKYTELLDWKRAFLEELPTRKGFGPVFDTADQDENSNVVDPENEPNGKEGTNSTEPNGKEGTNSTEPNGKEGTYSTEPNGEKETKSTEPNGEEGAKNTTECGDSCNATKNDENDESKSKSNGGDLDTEKDLTLQNEKEKQEEEVNTNSSSEREVLEETDEKKTNEDS